MPGAFFYVGGIELPWGLRGTLCASAALPRCGRDIIMEAIHEKTYASGEGHIANLRPNRKS